MVVVSEQLQGEAWRRLDDPKMTQGKATVHK